MNPPAITDPPPAATAAPAPAPLPQHASEPARSPAPWMFWLAAILIAAAGIALRVVPSAGFKGTGFDEALYRTYVLMLDGKSLADYGDLTEAFLVDQRKPDTITKLPPTRFLYIFCGWAWKRAEFGSAGPVDLKSPGGPQRDPALVSLHRVACLFTVLLMVVGGVAAWRMIGRGAGLAVLALLAASPLGLHMSQHALIDGFFAFWATLCLWLLWENLRQPDRPGWLLGYGAALGLMVMTKENSFFVFCALSALVVVNRWTAFGKVTPKLLMAHFAGPAFGFLLLVTVAGGFENFIETYKLLVAKAQNLDYAIKTGDGPWHRYLVDLMIATPLVLCLAIGGIFLLVKQHRVHLFLTLFIAFSYVIMCNVRYAMNLRYATVWELPLHLLAFGALAAITAPLGRRAPLVLLVAVAGLCAYGVRQYVIFSVDHQMYELVTEGLLRSVKILKN